MSEVDTSGPRVAILSAYHNRASVVEITLRSIQSQSYGQFEALIWDDASTDGTGAELDKVSAELNDPRFRIYRHEHNIGLTRGLNHALTLTSAEYVAIVGSGDVCSPDRLMKQVAALDAAPGAAFCASASRTIDPETGAEFTDEHFDGSHITRRDIETVCPFTHGTVMYRRSALLEIGGYDPVFGWCADWDVFFRLLDIATGIYLEDVLYTRYARGDGASFSPQKAFDQIRYKHLVLTLACASSAQRCDIIDVVKSSGLDVALEARRKLIARDLARRNAKLFLLRRAEAGRQMLRIARCSGVVYSPLYRLAISLSRVVALTPVSASRLISAARSIAV